MADYAFKKLEHSIFNNNSVGQLQQSLTDFAHRVEATLVKTDLLFGIAFIVLAVIIFAVLIKTRQPGTPDKTKDSSSLPPAETPPANTTPTGEALPRLKTPPRRPRLIQ